MRPKATSKYPRRASQENNSDLTKQSGEDLDQLILDIEIEENRRVCKLEPPKGCNTGLVGLSAETLQKRKAEAIAELGKRINPIVAERLREAGEQLQQEYAGLLAEPPADESRQARDTLDTMIANAHRAVAGFRINPRVVGVEAEPAPNAASSGAELTEREKKIWEVIRHGSRGMQYCRELDYAGIKPQKSGSWKGCPGTYPAAYQSGDPWRHRIQDQKTKIRRKAKLAKLAGE